MNKILRYSFALLLAFVGFSAQAQENVIWQEDWSGVDATVDPATVQPGVYTFTGTVYNDDGSIKSGTKFYDANLAGGEAPELLIAKGGGSFAVNIVFEGDAPSGEMTLSWKANKALTVEVVNGTIGEITSGGNDYSCPVTFSPNENNSMTIKFTMSGSSNARFDNAKLATGQGKKPAGLSYGTSARTVTIGADDNVFPVLQNDNNLPVTFSSSDPSIAIIDDQGAITLMSAGKTTIKAEFAGNDEYEPGHAQYELTVKEGQDPNAKGGVNNPYTVAEALLYINTLENGQTTEEKIHVKGYVVGTPDIQKKDDGTFYGNANFYIADEANGTTTLYCYRLKGLENANIDSEDYIKEGDQLVVVGQFQKYVKDEVVTPEVKNGHIVSIEGGGEIPGPDVQGTKIAEYDFTAATEYPYYRLDPPATGSYDVVDGALVINNTEALEQWWNLQPFILDWFNVQEGYNYDIAILMEATSEVDYNINFGTWSASMPLYGLKAPAAKGWNVSTIENATFSTSGNDAHILFQCGAFVGTVKIYKVELYEYAGTGVESIKTNQVKNGAIYNLAGQRVDENYRGIVIKNGKKVMQ